MGAELLFLGVCVAYLIYKVNEHREEKRKINEYRNFIVKTKKEISDKGNYSNGWIVDGFDPYTYGGKVLAISDDYGFLVFASEGGELEYIESNKIVEFIIKDTKGQMITQMTGGGAAVAVVGGLAFGGIGALVASSAAQRETRRVNRTEVIFEVIYEDGLEPVFSIKLLGIGGQFERLISNWNAKMKILLSNKK